LHEGFGFPILEAMAAGLPVLTADRGAMAEVGGEGVLPVDPENTRDIVRGMTVLAWDRDLRFRLAEAGPQLARRWNWDDTAQLTVEVYQRALLVPEGKK
jgi:glycosyltransferase involved in cell wall biosynthesis